MQQPATQVPTHPSAPTRSASWVFGHTEPDADRPMPAVPTAVLLVAAHGGAGISTLVALDDELAAASGWPPSEVRPVVVVCRSHAAGLIAAGRLLEAHRIITPLGVLVVADAPGHLPVALHRRLRLLAGVAPQVWRLPWVEAWRRSPAAGPVPPAVRKVLDQVLDAAEYHRLSMGA
jgi:hypothetical protein